VFDAGSGVPHAAPAAALARKNSDMLMPRSRDAATIRACSVGNILTAVITVR
jgi:hypothetical protein